jgi:hypothetical protein
MNKVTSEIVMKNLNKHLVLFLTLIGLWLVDASPTAPLGVVFVGEAKKPSSARR